ncbi:hypothetical protein KL935_003641 [Ogataea polymorpha]|nr:hypothetical protein KL935_003641 [Ogataea polymorpha]
MYRPSTGLLNQRSVPLFAPRFYSSACRKYGTATQQNSDFLSPPEPQNWYALLTKPPSQNKHRLANFQKEVIEGLRSPSYDSFNSLFIKPYRRHRDLAHVTNSKSALPHVPSSYDAPEALRKQLKRRPLPFHLSHRLSTYLQKKSLRDIGSIYFEIPAPRAASFSILQLEQLLSLILSTKRANIEIVNVARRILEDMESDSIRLGPLEQTKLVYFYTRLQMPFEEVIQKVLDKGYFHPHTWNLLLQFYTSHTDKILELMRTRVSLDRTLLLTLLEKSSSLNSVLNIVDIFRQRHMHLDQEALDKILVKLAIFDEYLVAKSILDTMIETAPKLEEKPFQVQHSSTHEPWVHKLNLYEHHGLMTTRRRRRLVSQIELVNEWLPDNTPLILYPQRPTPFLMHQFFVLNLSSDMSTARRSQISDLLELMNIAKIPILNKTVILVLQRLVELDQLRQQEVDLAAHLVELYQESKRFNSYLEIQATNMAFNRTELVPYLLVKSENNKKLEFEVRNGAGYNSDCYDQVIFRLGSKMYHQSAHLDFERLAKLLLELHRD